MTAKRGDDPISGEVVYRVSRDGAQSEPDVSATVIRVGKKYFFIVPGSATRESCESIFDAVRREPRLRQIGEDSGVWSSELTTEQIVELLDPPAAGVDVGLKINDSSWYADGNKEGDRAWFPHNPSNFWHEAETILWDESGEDESAAAWFDTEVEATLYQVGHVYWTVAADGDCDLLGVFADGEAASSAFHSYWT